MAEKITTSVTSRLRLTIEVSSGSNWGGECALDQVYSQTSRETLNKVLDIFLKAGVRVTIIGQPEVIAVTTATKR